MDGERFRHLEIFFARAAAATPRDRARIVAEATEFDAEIGSELARLLAVDPASVVLGDLVASAGASLVADDALPLSRAGSREVPDAGPPTTSPAADLLERLAARRQDGERYCIEGEIGRGGMGSVLRAYDPELRRELAMKVALQPDAATVGPGCQRLGRFLEEAQITGQLDHPGIVPVHELGLDPHGRLYFTMRLVQGRDLDSVYDLACHGVGGWSPARVLGVLLKVCEAVAYAHSKGVIHRDLKPSNVMVGRFGQVYVMDWGLAKVLGRPDAHDLRLMPPHDLHSIRSDEARADPSTPLVTVDGTVLGTPAYMSPEQASGEADAMDVRADVYALGAMLYQLFAGHAPYQEPGKALGPQRLRLAVLGGPPKQLARAAPATPPELVAIVERAMARAMADRYPTVEALADDLRAYVEGRVVAVYDTGSFTVLRKWVGRNRALSVALAAAVLAIAAGAIAFGLAARRANRAAALAGQNALAAAQREAAAQSSERRARRMTDLVEEALIVGDPNQGGRQEVSVADAMRRVMRRLADGELADDPQTEASLRLTIARILKGNGHAAEALPLAQSALAARERSLAGDHPALADAYTEVGSCLQALGQSSAALALFETALAMRQRLFPTDHRDVAVSLNNVGTALWKLQRSRDALTKLEAALAMYRRLSPGADAAVAGTLHNVAKCLQSLNHNAEALANLEEALALRRRLYRKDHPALALSLDSLALCLQSAGRSADALPHAQEAHAMYARLFTGNHPAVARSLTTVAACLRALRQHDEALPAFTSALAMRQHLYPDGHAEVADALANLAECLLAMGRSADALPKLEEALAMRERRCGARHEAVATSLDRLGACLDTLGRRTESLARYQAALAIREHLHRGDDRMVAVSLNNVAVTLLELGQSAEALPLAERAAAMAGKTFPAGHVLRRRIEGSLRAIRDSARRR